MIAVLVASAAFALGRDVDGCELDWEAQDALPALLAGCVHHYAVDATDVFFFEGDAAALLAQVDGLAALAPVTVVVHPGTTVARSPWGGPTRDIPADWRAALDFDCGRRGRHCRLVGSRMEVWTGGHVDAAELTFP
ncbi:MAG: hypothetical protein H6735_25295 [Alphaproteobacteria bacterium]|nr:hypothetical protein [Alphaproteobacteria bacterium]